MEVVYKTAESNEEIKNWVESNGGIPAVIDDPNVAEDKPGLRIDWKGKKDEAMLSERKDITRDITWEEFFAEMENQNLNFEYSNDEEVNLTWRYKFVKKYVTEE
jgi:hypothetical protein